MSAFFSLIVFTVIPLYAPSMIPQELMSPILDSGFDINKFTFQTAAIGVFAAALTLVKGFSEIASYSYLTAALASNVVTIYFTLTTLTLGDVGSFGITEISLDLQGGSSIMILDMRLFVWLAIITLGLQVLLNIFSFLEARRSRSTRSRAEQLAIDAQMQERHEIHRIEDG
jgi:hypothetical protein